jgi:hypothetical protein
MLHMRSVWEVGGGRAVPAWARVMQARSSDVRVTWAHMWMRENSSHGCPDV